MIRRSFLFVGVALTCWLQVSAQKSTTIASCENEKTELGTNWFTFGDGKSVISPKVGAKFPMTAGVGHDGKGSAKISFNTMKGDWGCGLGFYLVDANESKKSFDLGALGSGISFWYKGDGKASLQIGTSDVVDGVNYVASVVLPPTATWQKISVTWKKFSIPSWGKTKTPFNPAKATAIQWQIDKGAAGDFFIDDVIVDPSLVDEPEFTFGKIDNASLNVEIKPQIAYPKGSPVDKLGKLKVGKNENGVRVLCDQNGKPVQLYGMSSSGLQWQGVANLSKANMKTLREKLKATIFRIIIYVDEEGGYAYNSSLRSRPEPLVRGDGELDWGRIEDVVQWCGENGLYCLIDWHVHDPGNPQHWKYRNRKYPEKVQGMDLAADFFTYCARRFQNQKHVLYELCNEPSNTGKAADENNLSWMEHVKPYCEDMLKIIRSYDKDVIAICGSPEWSKDLESIVGNEPQDENGKVYDNVMYSYHFYAASHGENYRERFSKMAAQLPIFVTEWGTTKSDGRTDVSPDLAKLWLNMLDGDNEGKQVISWINWSFSADGGNSRMLRWDSGNIESQLPEILSESGKFVFLELQKADRRNSVKR